MQKTPTAGGINGEKGKLGIFYLKKIWQSTIDKRNGISNEMLHSGYVAAAFSALGIGMEPTYQYLFQYSPDFEAFEEWILANGHIVPEMVEMFNDAFCGKHVENSPDQVVEHALDENQLRQWESDGYIILRNAISHGDCEATLKLMEEFLAINRRDPATWYNSHSSKQGIMVQLFRHPQLNKNRFSSKIRKAYEQLWQRNDLMVSVDRVGFNPPETASYKFPGPRMHWDVSIHQPIPFGTQGILYLTDTAANQGAFSLIPGFHHSIGDWLKGLPADANPREEVLKQFTPTPIAANAGDFILWHQALPHGSSPNTSQLPRFVQYINYQPLAIEINDIWL